MNLFILSELSPQWTHVGWSVSYSLEETLADIFKPTFIYPEATQPYRMLREMGVTHARFDPLERHLQKVFKTLFAVKHLPKLGAGRNVLLVIGLTPDFLLALNTLRPILDQFDLRVAYLLDGFDPTWMPEPAASLDHLFVISHELATSIHQLHGIHTTFLPLAIDTTQSSLGQGSRWIDILNYGRTDEAVHQCLQQHFNQQTHDRMYFHSTFAHAQVYNQREHVILMRKLLSRSKISLCFEASYTDRFQGHSPLLYRWFEAWSAGCTVVGRKPFGLGVAELMDWENSTIPIPDDPSDWIEFFNSVLADELTLAMNARRNYQQCLLRHDWRYRIKDMLLTLNLPIPEELNSAIAQIQERAVTSSNLLKFFKSA